jgi:hypothetical protein
MQVGDGQGGRVTLDGKPRRLEGAVGERVHIFKQDDSVGHGGVPEDRSGLS